MTPRKRGGRTTPPGTQDPRARQRIVGYVGTSLEDLNRMAAAMGMPPLRAAPNSGICVACGTTLRPPPDGPDKDHSVCDRCFPDDMRDEWEGRQVDVTRVEINRDGVRVSEVVLPADPPTTDGDDG